RAHPAGPDQLQQAVFRSNRESLVAAELELLGLEEGEQALADEQGGEVVHRRGHVPGRALSVDDFVEPGVRQQAAPADEVEKFGHGGGCRHIRKSLSPVATGPRGESGTWPGQAGGPGGTPGSVERPARCKLLCLGRWATASDPFAFCREFNPWRAFRPIAYVLTNLYSAP